MKKALIMIAAALFIFAGCQKEKSVNESTSNNVIHIGVKQLASPTKVVANATELADLNADAVNFEWEEGDQVAFVEQTEFMNYFFAAIQGKMPETPKTTVYTCTDPTNEAFSGPGLNPAEKYVAVYPPYGINWFNTGIIYEETFRVNQILKQHTIFYGNLENGAPDYVNGSDSEFTLNMHSAIIHFKINGEAKIGRIEYKTKGSKGVNTALNFNDGVQLTDTPIDVYMDVAILDEGGFSLEFFDTSGNSLGNESTKFNLAGKYNTIIDFDKTFTLNAVE